MSITINTVVMSITIDTVVVSITIDTVVMSITIDTCYVDYNRHCCYVDYNRHCCYVDYNRHFLLKVPQYKYVYHFVYTVLKTSSYNFSLQHRLLFGTTNYTSHLHEASNAFVIGDRKVEG